MYNGCPLFVFCWFSKLILEFFYPLDRRQFVDKTHIQNGLP